MKFEELPAVCQRDLLKEFSTRSSVVVAGCHPVAIGHTFTSIDMATGTLDHPLTVVAEATLEEWVEQCARWGQSRQAALMEGPYFYRVVTD